MTIVIPYRDEVHKGLELKYALRSIEKYLSGWDEIILIGQHPENISIPFAYYDDYPGRKEFSIYNKLMAACACLKISDDFILWNDDHFLTQPLDVSQMKYWHNGRLEKELKYVVNGEIRTAGGRYRKAIEHTLEEAPMTLNWDIHVPIVFNKEKFKATFAGRQDELCVKSFYCYKNGITNNEFMEDLKIPFQMPYERLKEKIADRLFFSIDSAAIGPDLIRLWGELYPSPSKYEI